MVGSQNVSPNREGCYTQIKGSVLSFRNWMWNFSVKGKHPEYKIKFAIEWHIPTFSRIVSFADTTYLPQHPLPGAGIQSRNPLHPSIPCSVFQLALMMRLLAWAWEGSQKDGLRAETPLKGHTGAFPVLNFMKLSMWCRGCCFSLCMSAQRCNLQRQSILTIHYFIETIKISSYFSWFKLGYIILFFLWRCCGLQTLLM